MSALHNPVPWAALGAVVAMFVVPWLDSRGLFDGPREIRHRSRRHVCADCAEPWQPGHQCAGWQAPAGREPVVPLRPELPAPPPVHARLTRADQPGRLTLPAQERRP